MSRSAARPGVTMPTSAFEFSLAESLPDSPKLPWASTSLTQFNHHPHSSKIASFYPQHALLKSSPICDSIVEVAHQNPAEKCQIASCKTPEVLLHCKATCLQSYTFPTVFPRLRKTRPLNPAASYHNIDEPKRGTREYGHPKVRRTNLLGDQRNPASSHNVSPQLSTKSKPLHSFYKQRREDSHERSLRTYLPYRTSILGC